MSGSHVLRGVQAFLKRVVAVAGDVVEIGREVAVPDNVLPAARLRQREWRPGPTARGVRPARLSESILGATAEDWRGSFAESDHGAPY
jgi:hypothetical protein